MYAAESNAPERRGAQAPDLRGVAPMGRGETPGPRGEAKRLADAALPPETPPSPRSAALELSASCVRAGFRPRRAGGAYNTELAAAKGRSPEGGAPRGPRDGREKLSEKSS